MFADLSPADTTSEQTEGRFLHITIDRLANELVIREPETGKAVKIAAKITEVEEEEDDEDIGPLTPEEFRSALQRLDAIGITWTADRIPQIKPKESVSDEVFLSEEFEKIRREYPTLPIELSAVVFHALTGSQPSAALVGSQDDLEKKTATVEKFLITQPYKSEFFFKHAIKVPYLKNIDWEVVYKLSERNVKKPLGIAYALLSLIFLDPSRSDGTRQRERTLTVAIDEILVKELIGILIEVRDSLEYATEALSKQSESKGEKNANNDRKELE